ncbi:hypothetical protein E2562_034236 [Oryza meyeriana var. granulata]|uniref:Uncharacterized protein n=1 Tax=Oryza meyeriana var. granulata TaxID=110450 RepID=A0A6G1CAX7_9ORYZ|nr:hypothetical protein E2562_034236 [Oryza meyeriana var. granulata]
MSHGLNLFKKCQSETKQSLGSRHRYTNLQPEAAADSGSDWDGICVINSRGAGRELRSVKLACQPARVQGH